jgi:RNA polymerase sigma factor (TIGR02999 family)
MSESMPASDEARAELTQLLRAWSGGDASAGDAVLALVYDRIRQIAARRVRSDGGALQPTELVHELVINLLGSQVQWEDRVHFFKTAAVAMRNILYDLGRKQAAAKHGGGQVRVTLRVADADIDGSDSDSDAEALHEALLELRREDPRKADVIELIYLVGLGLEEVAGVLDVSLATVNRDLRFARAWIKQRLSE